jgi:streptogramin lyase
MLHAFAAALALASPTPQAAVDFKNFTYRAHPCSGNVPSAAVVRGGSFDYVDQKMAQGFTISVRSVTEGSLAAGTRQAVVILSCQFPIGGTASAYLFGVHGKTATLLAKIADADWGGDWGAGPDSIDLTFAKNVLTVGACANPSCDKSALTKFTLRGGKLVKLSAKTVRTQDLARLEGVKILGRITEYPISNTPYCIAAGRDGNLWFTENGKIGRVTLAGRVTEFAVSSKFTNETDRITSGPDGNLWFTETSVGKIARVTPSGKITEFATPTRDSGPNSITTGPGGYVWFTESGAGRIGRATPAGRITEFTTSDYDSYPNYITTGPGGKLWFVEVKAHRIGMFTSGRIFELAVASDPFWITSGPDGNLWFTGWSENKIGKVTPLGRITEYALSAPNSGPEYITTGPDGNLWFTETSASKIGKVTPSGRITEYATPTPASDPSHITAGPDGNLWFTESSAGKIGRVTPSGQITEFAVPTRGGRPDFIMTGPDGNLWFTEETGNRIGKITVR